MRIAVVYKHNMITGDPNSPADTLLSIVAGISAAWKSWSLFGRNFCLGTEMSRLAGEIYIYQWDDGRYVYLPILRDDTLGLGPVSEVKRHLRMTLDTLTGISGNPKTVFAIDLGQIKETCSVADEDRDEIKNAICESFAHFTEFRPNRGTVYPEPPQGRENLYPIAKWSIDKGWISLKTYVEPGREKAAA